MKKLLFILFIIFCANFKTQATHVTGGTIYWKCLQDGKFQFFMEVYVNCEQGVARWTYQDEMIDIVGSPLPSGGLSQIEMKPDLNRFNEYNQGNLNPQCSPEYGPNYSCSLGSQGMISHYYYASDPVTLTGVPPASGWQFYWEAPCCRPLGLENQVYNGFPGGMLLRAIMYANKDSSNTSICYDSSPMFRDLPIVYFCRNTPVSYGQYVIDADLDSIVYSWDRTYNHPINNPIPVPYKTGYNFDNPTPDKNFNANNKPSYLNAQTGVVDFLIHSGAGVQKFVNVIRADSYRDGVKIASTFREFPISIFDCPPLPDTTSNSNNVFNAVPELKFNGQPSPVYEVNVASGEKVMVDIQVNDTNSHSYSTTQTLNLLPEGLFTSDFQQGSPCTYSNNGPCAYLQNAVPVLDTATLPLKYKLMGQANIQTEFVWQTECSHLGENGKSKDYYFYFTVYDDHCPIVASRVGVLKVNVIPSGIFYTPELVCVNKVPSGNEVYWNIDSSQVRGFENTEIYRSDTVFSLIATITDSSQTSYLDTGGVENSKYFIKVKYLSCDSIPVYSTSSDTLSVPQLSLTVENKVSCFELNWSDIQPGNPDSLKKYYIYRESPENSGFIKIDSVNNQYTYCDKFYACGDSVFYYIERSVGNQFCSYSSDIGSDTLSVPQLSLTVENKVSCFELNWSDNQPGNPDSLKKYYIYKESPENSGFIKIDSVNNQYTYCDEFYACGDSVKYYIEGSFSNSGCLYSSAVKGDKAREKKNNVGVDLINGQLIAEDSIGNYIWYDCNKQQIIDSAVGQSYTPNDTGDFALILRSYGCADTSRCVPIYPVSLQENSLQHSLSLYPNPNNGRFYISGIKESGWLQVTIRNIHGQLVHRQQLKASNKVELNLEKEAGIYFIQLQNEKGEKAHFKVVKQ